MRRTEAADSDSQAIERWRSETGLGSASSVQSSSGSAAFGSTASMWSDVSEGSDRAERRMQRSDAFASLLLRRHILMLRCPSADK